MELQQVKSELIDSVGFNAEEALLFVRFKGKEDIYSYQNIAPELFQEMMEQKSVGSFFSQRIKPFRERYPFEKLSAVIDVRPDIDRTAVDFMASGSPVPATIAPAEIAIPDDPEELKKEALALSEKSQAIAITSPEAYTLAATTLLAIARMRAALETTLRPGIKEKHQAWQAELAILNHYDRPLESDDQRLRAGMIEFKRNEDAARLKAEQAERDRQQVEADAEARTRAQELQLADAIDAEQRGEPELAKVIIDNAPLPVQPRYVGPVSYASTVPKTAGITHVDDWTFEITDEKLIPAKYKVVDLKALQNEATTLKARAEVPGVRFYNKGGLRAAAKPRGKR